MSGERARLEKKWPRSRRTRSGELQVRTLTWQKAAAVIDKEEAKAKALNERFAVLKLPENYRLVGGVPPSLSSSYGLRG
jgi:hypothetical protein